MRTSIDIPDPLFRRARSAARRRKTTLRQVVLDGLRRVLEEGGDDGSRYVLQDESFGQGGLVEGLNEGDWEQIRDRAYEGRGG